MTKDGEPYMPANRTDGDDSERVWCAHCLGCRQGEISEDEFGNDVEVKCSLLDEAFYCQQPAEWKWRDGRPICTAFREDPENRARCLKTMEMF